VLVAVRTEGDSSTLLPVRFEKWQGLGNDYLIVRRDEWALRLTAARARTICDRNLGVGGDGILEIDFEAGVPRMTVWNPDGSNAENCGNGIRMVTRHLTAHGDLPGEGTVITGGGPVSVRVLSDDRVEVGMGRATFPGGEGREALAVNGTSVDLAVVTTGNPHAVIEHPDPAAVVRTLGPVIEVAPRFPDRTNVEFIRIDGPSELTMRVWERGVGETMACGTGACAAAVAAVRLSGATSPVTVHLTGGDLEIAVDDDLVVTMTGPAEMIYEGRLSPALVSELEAV
jgi:diaminopimelate epimerase